MKHPRHPLGRLLLAALLCVSLDAGLLRRALRTSAVAPGEVLRGSFARREGRASISISPWTGAHTWPDDLLGRDGRIVVMPGRSVGLPLVHGATYTFADAGAKRPPYLVFGLQTGGELTDPHVLVPEEGGAVRLSPWGRDRPWSEDEAWLAQLARSCRESEGGPPGASLRAGASGWSLRVGRCEVPLQLPGARGDDGVTVVALGGVDGLVVERSGIPLRVDASVNAPIIVAILAAAGVMLVGGGAAAAVLGSAVAAAVGLVSPVTGVLLFVAETLIAACASIARGARWLWRRSRRSFGLAALSIFAVALVLTLRAGGGAIGVPVRKASSCVVTGYSTVEGETLDGEQPSAGRVLASECPACKGDVDIRPRNGGTFAWVRDTFCGAESPAGAGGAVMFLGGGNDDFFWRRVRFGALTDLVQIVLYTFDPPTFDQWSRMRGAAERASLAAVESQAGAVRGTAACVRASGGRMFLFHDFLVWDLPAGRSAERQAMLDRRRTETEHAGGRFVDLLEATRAHASIAWFNDYIHPSEVGHRALAEIMCGELSR